MPGWIPVSAGPRTLGFGVGRCSSLRKLLLGEEMCSAEGHHWMPMRVGSFGIECSSSQLLETLPCIIVGMAPMPPKIRGFWPLRVALQQEWHGEGLLRMVGGGEGREEKGALQLSDSF